MARDSQFSFDGSWREIEDLLGGAASIDALARSTGALVRPRKVRDGSQILRLALGYAATGRSLRTTAAWSGLGLGISFSDVALLGRLREAGDFLASLTARLLVIAAADAAPASWSGPPIRLVDGSLFAGPGARGGQHRLHATYDPVGQVFTAIDVTPIHQGESLTTAAIEQGAVAVADRNYAKTRAFRLLSDQGAFFVVRTGLRSTRMIDPVAGERLTAKAVLTALGEAEAAELGIEMVEARPEAGAGSRPVKARLLILRAGEAVAKRETARIRRSSTRHGATPTKDTQALAKVVMLVTNLPVSSWPVERVADLYRLRWQVELAFKSLKSTFRMRDTPAKDPRLARVWILANLTAALLANILSRAIERAIPPSKSQTADA